MPENALILVYHFTTNFSCKIIILQYFTFSPTVFFIYNFFSHFLMTLFNLIFILHGIPNDCPYSSQIQTWNILKMEKQLNIVFSLTDHFVNSQKNIYTLGNLFSTKKICIQTSYHSSYQSPPSHCRKIRIKNALQLRSLMKLEKKCRKNVHMVNVFCIPFFYPSSTRQLFPTIFVSPASLNLTLIRWH